MLSSLLRPNIKALRPYSSARSEFKGQASTFLDANENPIDTGLNRYPDPLQTQLKTEISKLKNIPTQNIFLGNGSDEAIDLLFRIFCRPQVDNVITLPPTYGMYQVSADISDIEVRQVPLNQDFQPNIDAILDLADNNSKILFICSPNNPTGNDISLDAIRQLLASFSGIIVIDEAYIDFSEQASCLSLLSEFPNLVVLQTFSKAWGLAAIRLGIAFASAEIISYFNKVKPPYNVNQLTQNTALQALQKKSLVTNIINKLKTERKSLATRLSELPFVQKIYPSSANFLLLKVDNADELYNYLCQQGIIIRNRSKAIPNCIRITIGTNSQNQQLITALQTYTANRLSTVP